MYLATSEKTVSQVREFTKARGPKRLTLLTIAFYVDDEFGEAVIGVESLSAETGMKRDTIHGHLKALEAMGELEIVRTDGYANRYRILCGQAS